MSYHPIHEYALIGDCHSTALVHRSGSIDWACLLRFDSTTAFARILDARKGGFWSLSPVLADAEVKRRYVGDTMVLETLFSTSTGKARLLDFFAMRHGGRDEPYRQLIRIVEGIEGEVEFENDMQPRFDYGAMRPWIRHHETEDVYSGVGGNEAFVLSTDAPMRLDGKDARITSCFRVGAGQRVRFSLVSSQPHAVELKRVSNDEVDRRFNETLLWWREWIQKGNYEGDYVSEVRRSALVLKALCNAETGAIIAAPTTSLPERVGGSRNWDYRYCWVRDAALTMSALYIIGHHEVAEGFRAFIERSTAGNADDAQIMYGCFGERRLPETELDLEGYMGSRPVRIGNEAYHQRQLDIYGELLDASYLWRKAGHRISNEEWSFLRSLVDAACRVWVQPDKGIWEVRSEDRHFVHSKVMCWVAVDRGVQLAQEGELRCDLERWIATRDAIRSDIEANGVDPERGCFVQYYGGKALDASLLLLAHLGFVAPSDPRMRATVEAVMQDLTEDGFVLRYRTEETDDGVDGHEGTFLICSFWLVDALVLQGRISEAETLFQRLLAVSNDVQLLAEEYDPGSGLLLGNFPQAYSHMALINSAHMLWLAKQHREALQAPNTADRIREIASRPGPRRSFPDQIFN